MSDVTELPPAPAKAKSRLTKIALPAVVVLALAAGAVIGPKLLGGTEADAQVAPAPTTPADEVILEVAQMTANLAGEELHYGRVALSVVLAPDAAPETVTARFPLLKDAALIELSGSTPESLRTAAGVEDLRSRLSVKAQGVYPGGEIAQIVITELVVQ